MQNITTYNLNLPTQVNYQSLINSFLSGRNPKTIRAYGKDLEDFRAFCERLNNNQVFNIDSAAKILLSNGQGQANSTALAYKTNMLERRLQPATINRRLAALRSLVELANTLGIVPWSLKVSNEKMRGYRDTSGPGKDGVKAMLAQAQVKETPKSVRDEAILHLLYDLGLRRGEIIALDLDDFDSAKGTIAVVAKGQTQKDILTLPAETQTALTKWVEMRGDAEGPLFVNFNHANRAKSERLTGDGLYKIIKVIGQRAGLKKVRPHGIRHTAITEALNVTNGNIRAVAKFSRHANMQTVATYDDNRKDLGGNIAQMIASGVEV